MAAFLDDVVRRVSHYKRLSELCGCQVCFVQRYRRKREREKAGGRVSICVCHQTIKCQLVSVGSLVRVWWGPSPPVPSPLVLISQVDEHISSSPNPSPWIPAHMSGIHTNRHTPAPTSVNIAEHKCTSIHQGHVSWEVWKVDKKEKSSCTDEKKTHHTHQWMRCLSALDVGFYTSKIALHFISALLLCFSNICVVAHCSPPTYRSFHVTGCCCW